MSTEELIERYGERFVIDSLSLHLSEARQERIDAVLTSRITSMQVAIEDPADVHNALAIVRTAEAMGVSSVHSIGWPKKKRVGKSITRGTERWTELTLHNSLEDFLARKGDFKVAGACVEGGIPLHELPIEEPLILLFGNEHAGLTDEAKEACDYRYTIPMSGMVESFNLSVAAGISLYDTLSRRRSYLGLGGDLDEPTLFQWRATYFIRAIGRERAKHLLARHYADLQGGKTSGETLSHISTVG